MASIAGIKESSKSLLKDVCKELRVTQVQWVEQHLNSDHNKIREASRELQESGAKK